MPAMRLLLSACLTLLTLSGSANADQGRCTKENIEPCVVPMEKFNLTHIDSIVPTFTVETITEICKVYPTTEDCMRKYWDDCPLVQRSVYKGLAETYDYICNDTWNEYVSYSGCLATPALHEQGKECNRTLEVNLRIMGFYKNQHYVNSKICQYASDYITCVYNSVKTHCGEKAAEWQKGYDVASIDPMLIALGCVRHAEGYIYSPVVKNTGYGAAYSMVLPMVLVFILIIVVIFLVVFIIRRRQKQLAGSVGALHPHLQPVPPMVYRNDGTISIIGPPPPLPPGSEPNGAEGGNPSFLLPPPYMEKDASPPSYTSQAGTMASRGPHSGTLASRSAHSGTVASRSPYETPQASGVSVDTRNRDPPGQAKANSTYGPRAFP